MNLTTKPSLFSSSYSTFSSTYFSKTSKNNAITSEDNRLSVIDTVNVDEKSRLTLTKKAKDILHIQPRDKVVMYHDRENNYLILKIQRGADNNVVVDSWILKRNVLVGYNYDYKIDSNSSSGGSSIVGDGSWGVMQQQQQPTLQGEEDNRKKPFNIMIVDDEEDVLLSFKATLSSQGYNVEAFNNSQEALKRFLDIINTSNNNNISNNSNNNDQNSLTPYYDLVITDIRMKGLNGVQLYQILKALDKNVKILFISGLDTAEEIVSVLPDVRLNDIIRKPIEINRLNQIVRNKISLSLLLSSSVIVALLSTVTNGY